MSQAISKKRLLIFRLVMLSFPLLFFVLLESGLRYFDYGKNLDLFVPVPAEYGDASYLRVNPVVASRYFSKVGRIPLPTHELFLKEKPANSYRIFVMGGSTVAGWPYPNNVMFTRILRQRLSDAFPQRHIEVINTGIAAINSFALLDFTDEILAQQPDAVLIYAGHNEFYGALGAASTESLGNERWIVNTYLSLLHFKTMQLLRDVGLQITASLSTESIDFDTYPTLMGRMIGEQQVLYNDDTYLKARENYQANLHDILQRFNDKKVPVMLSELISNVRDHAPFTSVDTDQYPRADAVYAQAQQLESDRKYERARAEYYRAKDLDALRFRASEDFNAAIRQVAAGFAAPVVPMKSYFEQASPQGLIGNNLILEHLHPNVDGYHLLADGFFNTLREQKFISSEWDESNIHPAEYYLEQWPITALDRALGKLRIIGLMDNWPFTPLDNPGKALEQYQPANKTEALALQIKKNEISFRQGHVELARQYAKAGEPNKALREYLTLISAEPFRAEHYLFAAKEMLNIREYKTALMLLHASFKFKDTPIGHKWLGQTLLALRNPIEALTHLEHAQKGMPNDPQILYLTGIANVATAQQEAARNTLSLLTALSPEYPGIDNLTRMIETRWPQADSSE